jgi:hypothetical protein
VVPTHAFAFPALLCKPINGESHTRRNDDQGGHNHETFNQQKLDFSTKIETTTRPLIRKSQEGFFTYGSPNYRGIGHRSFCVSNFPSSSSARTGRGIGTQSITGSRIVRANSSAGIPDVALGRKN